MTEAQYFTQQYEKDEDVAKAKGGTWNAKKNAYSDCPTCEGVGRWWEGGQHCETCYERRIADLGSQLERQTNRALKWRRQAAYYKLREKRCMGEASYTSVERVDDLERQRDDLKNALIAIRDEFDGKCWEWCDTRQLTVPAEFQVHGMPRFVAREALRRLEGEAASDESHSDSATQG